MTRNEFLKKLNEALKMSLDKNAINEQLDYYDKYISDEVAKGRTEKEIIDELGDPALIAKTIKTVSGSESISYTNDDTDESTSSNNHTSSNGGRYVYTSGTRATIGCIIFLLVIFIIAMLLFRLLGILVIGSAGVLFGFGPFTILIILLLIYLFTSRR